MSRRATQEQFSFADFLPETDAHQAKGRRRLWSRRNAAPPVGQHLLFRRTALPKLDRRPLCACGCGEPVTVDIRNNRIATYISGHNGRGERRKPWVAVTCNHCGGTKEFMPFYAKGRKYCSMACRDAFRRARVGAAHPLYNRQSAPCATCGKEFLSQPGKLRRKDRIYCSQACGREGWRRAVTSKPRRERRGTSFASRREQAIHRDGNRCRVCGFASALHVHHIVPRRKGGGHDLGNLVTLCPNHHAMAHTGELSQTDLFAVLAAPLTYEHFREGRLSLNLRMDPALASQRKTQPR